MLVIPDALGKGSNCRRDTHNILVLFFSYKVRKRSFLSHKIGKGGTYMNFPKAVSMDYIMINEKKRKEKRRENAFFQLQKKTRCLFQLHTIFKL